MASLIVRTGCEVMRRVHGDGKQPRPVFTARHQQRGSLVLWDRSGGSMKTSQPRGEQQPLEMGQAGSCTINNTAKDGGGEARC